jgi:hypothetical protein
VTTEDETDTGRRGFSRRKVLKIGAGAVVLATVGGEVGAFIPGSQDAPDLAGFTGTPSFTTSIVRREDMFCLDLVGYNLVLTSDWDGANPRLTRQQAGAAYLVANFVPQSLGEQAFPDGTPASAPMRAALSGTTALAFVVPQGTSSIPYDLGDLLNWAALELNVGAKASFPAGPDPVGPVTGIEAPWHLVISPQSTATWTHAVAPVTHGNRTELWHTSMAGSQIRAIASTDTSQTDNVLMPLTPTDRSDIVDITTTSAAGVNVETLLLSPLGAFLNLHGSWPPVRPDVPIIDWRQRMTMGRDQFVRVVLAGYLFPFGHRAAMIEQTERKVINGEAVLQKRVYIVVRDQVLDYTTGPNAQYEPNKGRGNPFRKITLLTLVTPDFPGAVPPENLVAPTKEQAPDRQVFWAPSATDLNQPFRFSVEATDVEGQVVHFTAPLIFVDQATGQGISYTPPPSGGGGLNPPEDVLGPLLLAYQQLGYYAFYPNPLPITRTYSWTDYADVTIALNGKKLAYAPPTPGKAGDTSMETFNVVLGALGTENAPADFLKANDEPAFFPTITGTSVRLGPAEAVSGQTLNPAALAAKADPLTGTVNVGVRMSLHSNYLAYGFDAADAIAGTPPPTGGWGNAGSVLLESFDPPVPLDFSSAADKIGGVAATTTDITGYSRELGTFGGAASYVAKGWFDPATFFRQNATKLLGNLNLTDILPVFDLANPPTDLVYTAGDTSKVPKIVSVVHFPNNDKTKPPTSITTTVTWNPVPQSAPDVFVNHDDKDQAATLSLLVTILTDLVTPANSTYTINGDLRNFQIILFTSTPFLTLTFSELKFTADKGSKPKIDVELANVVFGGPLGFINILQNYLSTLGVPGLSITTGPTGIDAGYSLALPDVGVGVFSLQNLSLSAGLHLPFIDAPTRIRFAFCTRENPFLLTVSLFGGGGFVNVAIGTDGLEMFEVSLEFGGALALNLGIASGSVSVAAGIYFQIEQPEPQDPKGPPERVTLTGFLRIDGQLTVLGIVSISAEFYMGLSYMSTNKAEGRATLTVSVHIAFFSKSVSLSVERRIGGNGDPSFSDTISPADWQNYCAAFAVEG